jgi:hypothetical protein
MRAETTTTARSFAVHQVERATQRLPECKLHEALPSLIGSKAEALCEWTAGCITGVRWHPLVAAAHQAWCDHRPLVLSPDMIWLAILQGLAQHVKNDPERLRGRFVSFAGREELSVVRDDLVNDSPENPWPEVVREFSDQVHAELGPEHAWLAADFSTTGPKERVAADIVLLDAMQPFFEYRAVAACGIPSILLEGTVDDWQRLADKVDRLERYDLGWWLDHLRPIARQFARAAAGDVDLDHWRNIYKRLHAYGGSLANSWLVKLMPYLKQWHTGQFTERNRLLEEPFAPYPSAPAVPKLNRPAGRRRFYPDEPAVSPRSLPTGVSAAPFTLVKRARNSVAMEFLGGFLGVTQDAASLALRPYIGWAVRRRSPLDQLLLGLRSHATQPALPPREFNAAIGGLMPDGRLDSIPGDFLAFYKTCNGGDLFVDTNGTPVYHIRPLGSLETVKPRCPEGCRGLSGYRDRQGNPIFGWVRFADLRDGSFLSLDFDYHWAEPDEPLDRETSLRTMRDREVWHVIHCREQEPDPRQAYRVVAWSFSEFLRLALAGNGHYYWDEPGFEPRGDAFSKPRYSDEFPLERVAEARPNADRGATD